MEPRRYQNWRVLEEARSRKSTISNAICSHFGQFAKFCLVGGSGILVDMGVLYILADSRTLGWNIALSKICAAEVALVNNFIWNELWTFKEADAKLALGQHSIVLKRFLFFNAICGLGVLLAVLLLHLFHTVFAWNLYLSNLLAIGLVTFWNFGMNLTLNWGRSQAKRTHEG